MENPEKIAILALLFALPIMPSLADDIRGRVVDAASGESLPGATVTLSEAKGTLSGHSILPADFRTMDVVSLLSDPECFGTDGLHLLEQQQMRNNYSVKQCP